MKKKSNFFTKLKNKFKKNDSSLEFEDLRDNDDEHEEQDVYEEDEDLEDAPFDARPMTFSRKKKDELDQLEDLDDLDKTSPGMNISDETDSTQEMQRPNLSQQEESERLEAIRQNAYEEDDFNEHSGINSFKEFQLPKNKTRKSNGLKRVWKKLTPYLSRKPSEPTSKKVHDKPSLSNIKWDHVVASVFSVPNRSKIHKAFIICLISFTSYGIGKSIGLFLEDTGLSPRGEAASLIEVPEGTSVSDIQTIAKVDLFNASPETENEEPVEVEPTPQVDENLICKTAQKNSGLPIDLKNTVVLQDSVKSVASVQVRGQKEAIDIREGQRITNIAEVGKIDRQRLIFKNLNSGECEYIQNQEDDKGAKPAFNVVSREEGQPLLDKQQDNAIKNEGNSFSIKKSLRDEMLGNISEVLTQARAIQIQNSDGSYAFKMTEIVPGSIYSKLNIKNGDIIEQIDGQKISDLNEVMTKFGRIREVDNLSLTIKRDGSTQTYDYSFE